MVKYLHRQYNNPMINNRARSGINFLYHTVPEGKSTHMNGLYLSLLQKIQNQNKSLKELAVTLVVIIP